MGLSTKVIAHFVAYSNQFSSTFSILRDKKHYMKVVCKKGYIKMKELDGEAGKQSSSTWVGIREEKRSEV